MIEYPKTLQLKSSWLTSQLGKDSNVSKTYRLFAGNTSPHPIRNLTLSQLLLFAY